MSIVLKCGIHFISPMAHTNKKNGKTFTENVPAVMPGWIKLALPLIPLLILAIGVGGRPITLLIITAGLTTLGIWINRPSMSRRTAVHWYAGLAILIWLILTTVPLPQKVLGDKRAAFHKRADTAIAQLQSIYPHPDFKADQTKPDNSQSEFSSVDSDPPPKKNDWHPLTLNRSGTVRFFLLFTGAWCMMWMTSALTTRQRHKFLVCLVTGGTVVAAASLVGLYLIPPGRQVWWFIPVNHSIGAGPFININHFASFCALLTPAAMSLIISPRIKGRRSQRNNNHETSTPDITPENPSAESQASRRKPRNIGKRIFFGVCLAVLITATILSFSRGGMVMMLIGSCVAGVVWMKSHPAAATGGVLLAIAILMAFLFWPSSEVQREIATLENITQASPKRNQLRREAIRQWKEFPVFGGGAESYRTLNGIYKSQPSTKSPLYVENEYAQWLAEHGWMGVTLGTFFICSLVWLMTGHFYHNAREKKKLRLLQSPHSNRMPLLNDKISRRLPRIPPANAAAGAGALAGLLFHIACDFPMRVPLNAFLGAALAGTLLPLPLHSSRERGRAWKWRNAVLTALLFSAVFLWPARKLQLDNPNFLRRAGIPVIAEAIANTPAYWAPWDLMRLRTTTLAYEATGLTKTDKAEKTAKIRNAEALQVDFHPMKLYRYGVECLEVAAKLNRADYRMWEALAQTYRRLGGYADETVRQALRKSVKLAPEKKHLWRQWNSFEEKRGELAQFKAMARLAKDIAPQAIAVRQFSLLYRNALLVKNPEVALEATRQITSMAPQKSRWWERRGQLEEQLGQTQAAIDSLVKATKQTPQRWQVWLNLGKLYLQENREEAANRALTQATRIRPELRDKVDKIWAQFQVQHSQGW
ncbi:MAG: O-antigen ligase family protein [Lentisphaeria bacterium]